MRGWLERSKRTFLQRDDGAFVQSDMGMLRAVKEGPRNRHRALAHLDVHAVGERIDSQEGRDRRGEFHADEAVADQQKARLDPAGDLSDDLSLYLAARGSQSGIVHPQYLVRAARFECVN